MRYLIILLAVIALSAPVSAQTITVALDGSGDYLTIQEGIDAVVDGYEVVVADGTYTGVGNRDIDFKGKAITVRSENGPDSCIIDCESEGRGFYFHNGEDDRSILQGLTITNGYADNGGGICCYGESSVMIITCKISNNSAYWSGGGVYCNNKYARPQIIDSSINGNTAHRGGGLSFFFSTPKIIGCHIVGNTSSTRGGGLYFYNLMGHNNVAEIVNCVIAGNTADDNGGCFYTKSRLLTIANCTIVGNVAQQGSIGYASGFEPIIVNSIYWGNGSENDFHGEVDVRYSYAGDPNFVDPDSGDYRLMGTSPCIEAGTNEPGVSLPETDIDGNVRRIDYDNDGELRVDMGAYETRFAGGAYLHVSTEEITFAAVESEAAVIGQMMEIRNLGTDLLRWSISEDADWLEVSPSSGDCQEEGDKVVLSVDATGLLLGDYECDLIIMGENAAKSPQGVTVKIHVHEENILYVPSECATIQAGINASADGDTVIVIDGVYKGSENRNIDFKGKAITVRSENGPENCVIDCGGIGRGFNFHSAEGDDSVLEGITVANGFADVGGGIYCASSPLIRNCIIRDNSTHDGESFGEYGTNAGDGGGIYVASSGVPTISHCVIRDNTTGRGAWLVSSDPYNPWEGSTNGGNGGGIFVEGSAVITDCLIVGNQAGLGAPFGWVSSGAESGLGGAIAGGTGMIINCEIIGNKSTGLFNCNGDIINCVVRDNSGGYGGGLRKCDGNIVNCTITMNSSGYGGAMNRCKATVRNSIIWGNVGSQISFTSTTTPLIMFSNVEGGWDGEGNIETDPLFFDPDEDDYHLQSEAGRWDPIAGTWVYDDVTSLCIDSGSPGFQLGDEFSEESNVRINMGAYGGTAEASRTPAGWGILSDMSNDRSVGMADFGIAAELFGLVGERLAGDLDRDGRVGLGDLVVLIEEWMGP